MNEIARNDEGPEGSAADPTDETVGSNDDGQSNRQSYQRQESKILDQRQCLAGLSRLPGLLAMGVVKPAQANAMRGVFKDLLDHHREDRQQVGKTLDTDDVVAKVRENPALLNLLAPLLTDEQIDMIMEAIKRD